MVHNPHHNDDPGSEGLPLTKTDRHGERGVGGGNDDLRMTCSCPADPAEGNIRADFPHSEGQSGDCRIAACSLSLDSALIHMENLKIQGLEQTLIPEGDGLEVVTSCLNCSFSTNLATEDVEQYVTQDWGRPGNE